MTVHFDNTRWDAMMAGVEAMAEGAAFCRDCGINVTVDNGDVRVNDGHVHPLPDGDWFVLCSACEQRVTSR